MTNIVSLSDNICRKPFLPAGHISVPELGGMYDMNEWFWGNVLRSETALYY